MRDEDLVSLSHSRESALAGIVHSQTEQEDAELVYASQQGNLDAFALLVQKHQRRVFTMAWHMIRDYDKASENTQEAFLTVWRELPSFRGGARFSPWLYRIAYRCCVQHLEQHKREQTLQTARQGEQGREGVNTGKRVADTIERHDSQATVRECLEQLPTKYRMIVILRHLQDMTYEEIADILTLPIGTVKSSLFRARNLLKERVLAQHFEDDKTRNEVRMHTPEPVHSPQEDQSFPHPVEREEFLIQQHLALGLHQQEWEMQRLELEQQEAWLVQRRDWLDQQEDWLEQRRHWLVQRRDWLLQHERWSAEQQAVLSQQEARITSLFTELVRHYSNLVQQHGWLLQRRDWLTRQEQWLNQQIEEVDAWEAESGHVSEG